MDFIATLNPGSKRRSKPSDGIYLMQNIRRPGVLIECGFLSNPEEEARLRNAGYQKEIACVTASCISRFQFE
jgi:N-acetylmuramoyl-L-alanine amidase